jgi:hypothetical protein
MSNKWKIQKLVLFGAMDADSQVTVIITWRKQSKPGTGGRMMNNDDLIKRLRKARVRPGRYKADNYIDLAGYAACAAEIADRCMPVAKEEGDI